MEAKLRLIREVALLVFVLATASSASTQTFRSVVEQAARQCDSAQLAALFPAWES